MVGSSTSPSQCHHPRRSANASEAGHPWIQRHHLQHGNAVVRDNQLLPLLLHPAEVLHISDVSIISATVIIAPSDYRHDYSIQDLASQSNLFQNANLNPPPPATPECSPPAASAGRRRHAITGTSGSTRTIAISSQPSRFGQRTQSLQTFSGSVSFVDDLEPELLEEPLLVGQATSACGCRSRRASSTHHSTSLRADPLAAVRLVDGERADLRQVGPDDRQRDARRRPCPSTSSRRRRSRGGPRRAGRALEEHLPQLGVAVDDRLDARDVVDGGGADHSIVLRCSQ